MEHIPKTIELEFTILEFHENFVISRVRENVVLSKKQVRDLVDVCSDFYKRKKLGISPGELIIITLTPLFI